MWKKKVVHLFLGHIGVTNMIRAKCAPSHAGYVSDGVTFSTPTGDHLKFLLHLTKIFLYSNFKLFIKQI